MTRLSILSVLLLLSLSIAHSQPKKLQFTHLSSEEGLSQSHVNTILKDSKGFMWFGTEDGLNEYDGYTFSVYKHTPALKGSLSNNYVYDLLESKDSTLWIATREGLDKFDRTTDTFVHYLSGVTIHTIFQDSKQRLWVGTTQGLYLIDNNVPRRLSNKIGLGDKTGNNTIVDILDDASGNLWLATSYGLYKYNPATGQVVYYSHDARKPNSLPANSVRTLFRDRDNTIWIGTSGGGVARYKARTDDFDHFLHDAKNKFSLGHNDVLSLMQAADGSIWVGTENGGISVYDRAQNRFSTVVYDPLDKNSLSNNSVYCLYKDDINNIWVGTYSGGINFMSALAPKFKLYRHEFTGNTLTNNLVLFIKGDAGGTVWLGTDGGGLNRFDPKTEQFTAYQTKQSRAERPTSDYVISLDNLGKDRLIVGYHRNGIDFFDTKRVLFSHYVAPPGFLDFTTASINTILVDKDGDYWFGTWNQGVYVYNSKRGIVKQYRHDPDKGNTLCNNLINCIYQDTAGLVWIGTENGLDCLNPVSGSIIHYTHSDKISHTISNNTINCLAADTGDRLWVGTSGGLCLLDKKTGKAVAAPDKKQLADKVINSLVKDRRGNLWIGSNEGITRYNPYARTVRDYDVSDGLQGSEFKSRSAYQAPDGKMYFGGVNGLNVFHPDSMPDNAFIPPVYITDFQIFNRSAVRGEPNSPLTAPIIVSKKITLTYDQNVFSLGFSALNYTLSAKNKYAYKLEGFDKGWNYVATKRTATYTNLDPGEYVFRVKGSNNDGVWNEKGASITVEILPPYWRTWWFRLLAVVSLLGAVYCLYQARVGRLRAQKLGLEQLVEERTGLLHQEQILNKLKSQFVSTVSHEFRTPLATIQTSIDLVDKYLDFPADNARPLIRKHLHVVEREIGKFGILLDDVLTIEKMNAGKAKFLPQPVDLATVYEDVISTHFQNRDDQRSVDVAVFGHARPAFIDARLISHALVNLLSNAFKFSATNPRLTVTYAPDTIAVAVADNGIGIPEKDQSHLFETFFRANNVSTIQGTGLGLFITRQAVELHGGTVQVQSRENQGTTFTISLPT